MIFLCFALKIEAEPFIDYFNLKKVHDVKKARIYKKENILAIITGTGVIKAAEGLSNLLARYYKDKDDIILNIGVAGGSKRQKLGDVFIINKLVGINDNEYFLDIDYHPFKEAELKTILRKDINKYYYKNLVDLEGEAFYRVAQSYVFQQNIKIIKIISDNQDSRKLDKEFVKKLVKNSSIGIIEYIDNLKQDKEKIEKIILFTKEDEKLLKIIGKNYRLSKYLELELKNKAVDYKIRGNDLTKLLKKFSEVKAKDKKDRRNKYDKLKEKLDLFKG
ncbi:MAG: hypothetical protein R6U59_05820 [Eubacteriales bacterium]